MGRQLGGFVCIVSLTPSIFPGPAKGVQNLTAEFIHFLCVLKISQLTWDSPGDQGVLSVYSEQINVHDNLQTDSKGIKEVLH